MKYKFIFPLVLILLFSNGNAQTNSNEDDTKKIEELEAEIKFLKLENAKLKNTTTTHQNGENQNVFLKIRKKKLRPTGKGWFITTSAGYGIPFLTTNKKSPLREIGEGSWEQTPTTLSRKALFGTNGGGFAFNFGWGHMFNKHIGIEILHTFAWHPESLDAKINTVGSPVVLGSLDLGTPSYYATQKTSTFAMYVSPHLVMRWDNGKRFGITGKAGLVVPIFGNTVSRAAIDDKSGRLLQTLNGIPPVLGIPIINMTLNATAKTSYKPTVGISTSIGFDVKLSKNIWLYAETRIQAYTIKLVQTVMHQFSMKTDLVLGGVTIPTSLADNLIKELSAGILSLASLTGGLPLNVNNASEAPKFLTHYNYVDEITAESNTARYGFKSLVGGPLNFTGKPQVDLDKPMDEPGQKFNTSTLYFNLGLRINFDRWSKKKAK